MLGVIVYKVNMNIQMSRVAYINDTDTVGERCSICLEIIDELSKIYRYGIIKNGQKIKIEMHKKL